MVATLATGMHAAIVLDGGEPPPWSMDLHNFAAAPFTMTTTQNRFMALWLVLGVPWPEFATQPDATGAFTVAAALGNLFDNLAVQPSYLRQWAGHWLDWSEAHLRAHALVWRAHAPAAP